MKGRGNLCSHRNNLPPGNLIWYATTFGQSVTGNILSKWELPINKQFLKNPSRIHPVETIFELDMLKRKLRTSDLPKTTVRFEFCWYFPPQTFRHIAFCKEFHDFVAFWDFSERATIIWEFRREEKFEKGEKMVQGAPKCSSLRLT